MLSVDGNNDFIIYTAVTGPTQQIGLKHIRLQQQ